MRGGRGRTLNCRYTYLLVLRSITLLKKRGKTEKKGMPGGVGIRTVLASITLFIIGSFMIYYGQVDLRFGTESNSRDRGLSMIIVGSLAFLPGSYAVIALFGAWRRWPGYSFESIPSYDD